MINGTRVRLGSHYTQTFGPPKKPDRVGVVIGQGREDGIVRVLWDGRKQTSPDTLHVSFLEVVK